MSFIEEAKAVVIKCLLENDQGLCTRKDYCVMLFEGKIYDDYNENEPFKKTGVMRIGGWGLGDKAVIFKKNNVWYDDDDKKNEWLSDWSLLIPPNELERIGITNYQSG